MEGEEDGKQKKLLLNILKMQNLSKAFTKGCKREKLILNFSDIKVFIFIKKKIIFYYS